MKICHKIPIFPTTRKDPPEAILGGLRRKRRKICWIGITLMAIFGGLFPSQEEEGHKHFHLGKGRYSPNLERNFHFSVLDGKELEKQQGD
ncbi:MAG: hypothetical protein HQM08_18840 [Candidatus Riflebacteria bacterium]|nr:hypothetical protein [Candidatus Riflebacteria bacterium]